MQEISLKNSLPAIFQAVLNFDICKLFVCNVKVRFLSCWKNYIPKKDDSLHPKCYLAKFDFCNAELVQNKMIDVATACSSVFLLSKLKK